MIIRGLIAAASFLGYGIYKLYQLKGQLKKSNFELERLEKRMVGNSEKPRTRKMVRDH